MRLVLWIAVGLVAALILAGGIVALLGSRLPKAHVATRSVVLPHPPSQVYAIARDFGSAASWRPDVKRIEVTQNAPGPVRFREEGKHGTVNYELAEDVPNTRMVTRILDTDLGYSGSWTYEFATEGAGTRVTITENGEVSNVIFRFMAAHFFSPTDTIDGYLDALAKRLGR